jgi:hypothetical protein
MQQKETISKRQKDKGSQGHRGKSGSRQAAGSQILGRLHAGCRQTNRRQAGRQKGKHVP